MKITIIGAGIAGLTTALALQKLGFDCEVFERAKQLNEVGAGIWIQANALKILDWLELGDQVRNGGTVLKQVEITNAQLIPYKKTSQDVFLMDEGNNIVSIHRAALQKILYDSLPRDRVKLGWEFSSLEQNKNQVKASFGEKDLVTDLLIGADGIHSKVRDSIFLNTSKRFSGQTCWRGISDMTFSEPMRGSGIESWGQKRRFGFSQISENQVYWFAVKNASENGIDNIHTIKSELQEYYSSFHPLVLDIIENTDRTKIIRNDISDLRRLEKWHEGRVLLIGDAAHAATPNMGQGAGQGIEDAYYFANLLAKNQKIEQAFDLFESQRRNKVDFIVNNSWKIGKMAHNGFGQWMMKAALRFTPEIVTKRQMNKLYSIREDF